MYFHIFVSFSISFISVLVGKDAQYDFNLLKFIETFCGLASSDLSWRMFHVHLKNLCFDAFAENVIYIYIPIWPNGSFKAFVSLLIFY